MSKIREATVSPSNHCFDGPLEVPDRPRESIEQSQRVIEPVAERFNEGKPQMSLVPADAQIEEAKVWAAGAEKYGRSNWEKLWGDDTINVVLDSLLRHVLAIQQGEVWDKETGAQHAGHIRCNAAMLIRYFNKGNKI